MPDTLIPDGAIAKYAAIKGITIADDYWIVLRTEDGTVNTHRKMTTFGWDKMAQAIASLMLDNEGCAAMMYQACKYYEQHKPKME